MPSDLLLGVDVGTGSARAGLFDRAGARLGAGVHPIQIRHPREDFAEHSSDDIWRACGVAIRTALAQAGARPEHVRGIGFDATCSLVVLDERDRPVSVSPDGSAAHDTIVWLDHRAVDQAARINATRHEVLRYVGGTISPEMQTPKLLWLKENLPDRFARAARFLDLPDFLSTARPASTCVRCARPCASGRTSGTSSGSTRSSSGRSGCTNSPTRTSAASGRASVRWASARAR